jgi:glycerophosphoryl diester phosphodiesterase
LRPALEEQRLEEQNHGAKPSLGVASASSMRGRRRYGALGALVLATSVWAGNSSWLHGASGRPPLLLAHRGVAQTFPIAGLSGTEDTSKLIYPPEHPFLENTIASMQKAFEDGADIVELDVQLTADGHFAVFHDATLDFRTDGRGPVSAHLLSELQTLDVGYGYSADGGKTFPFRGKGVGLMPSLEQVLDRFPDQQFLIDVKSFNAEEGRALADFLGRLPAARLQQLAAYGGTKPIEVLSHALPALRVMSRSSLIKAGLEYLALGWTGYVPAACRATELHLPLRFAPLFWGWPHRFLARMDAVGTRVVLVAGDGRWSEGFDTVESLREIPSGFSGVIWTNRIDRIAAALGRR